MMWDPLWKKNTCSEDPDPYKNNGNLLILDSFEIVYIAIFNIKISYVEEHECANDQNQTRSSPIIFYETIFLKA